MKKDIFEIPKKILFIFYFIFLVLKFLIIFLQIKSSGFDSNEKEIEKKIIFMYLDNYEKTANAVIPRG